MDIMAIVPIILSCAVWGTLLSGSNVRYKCDNTGVVESINKKSSKEQVFMHLLRCLRFFSAYFSITFSAYDIPRVLNTNANQLQETIQQYF